MVWLHISKSSWTPFKCADDQLQPCVSWLNKPGVNIHELKRHFQNCSTHFKLLPEVVDPNVDSFLFIFKLILAAIKTFLQFTLYILYTSQFFNYALPQFPLYLLRYSSQKVK